ncbi:MAG: winged helix-turn-helix transcriptional regulator [Thaumarchaeota archaeon]|nr:winged helix-turn-helix transcriptional regulator [Nitrososphaerota archaeon]
MSIQAIETKPYSLLFQAFANPTRVKILQALRERANMTVMQIGEDLSLEQTNVSHNLRCLAFCGLVSVERKGKSRVYSLNKETVLPMLETAEKHLNKYAENLLTCDVLER